MLSLALATLTLLQGIALGNPTHGFGSAPDPPLAERAQCNYDNCLRVMTNTPPIASSFCSTWLQPTSVVTVTPTVTIDGSTTITPTIPATTPQLFQPISQANVFWTTYPPLTSRLSSACSCLGVVPSSSTVTVTSYAPTTTTTITCEGLGSTYTANGETFNVYCDDYYIGPTLATYYDGQIPDMAACITQCSITEGCISINFADATQTGGEDVTWCALYSSITTSQGAEYEFAVLANYNGAGYVPPSE